MTTPVLIDTDPGCDDAIAVLLALEYDDLAIAGITTVHGNAKIEDTTRNARAVLELFDRSDVPVARGCGLPLLDPLETAEHIHGPGGIKGPLPDPTAATEPVESHAAQFIIETAREYDGELTLITIGRLTNVAIALSLEPALPELLDRLVVMGGAAFVPGNVTPLASANFYGDSHAAARVVRDMQPTVIPLDATESAALPVDWIDSIPKTDPRSEAIVEWLTYYAPENLERYGLEAAAMHDGLAITSLVADILSTEEYYAEVVTDGGTAHGALVCDARGDTGMEPNVTVATGSEVERFRELVMTTIDGVVS